jgi:hypothetical protein
MMSRLNRIVVVCFALVAFGVAFGCGKSIEQKQAEQAAKNLAEAGKKMEEAMKQGGEGMGEAMKKMGEAMTSGKKVEPVDFRVLKSLLPESLPGMKRTSATGEKNAALGINVSKAEAEYQAEGDKGRIDLNITDMGSMSGLTAMAAFGWATAEIDRETDSGYEKTSSYGGYKAFEKYNKSDQNGEIQVLIGNRFGVEVKGYGVAMDQLNAALSKIDLAKLDGMKTQGVQP